jgi:uncharacterized RDD family membrane protein YckC
MVQNFCPTCGGELVHKDAEICPKCGVRIKEPPKPVAEKYAGFWVRLGAYLIDGIIITVVIYASLFMIIGIGAASSPNNYYSYLTNPAFGFLALMWIIFSICFLWIYSAYQESSSTQATIGKRAVRIIVTDTEGNRISFGRATGRWLAKILSALVFCIGFILIGFTENKQGLHDMIADTYVIYQENK